MLFNINRLDLADWGIVVSGSAARDGGVCRRLAATQPSFIADIMREADDAREIDFDLKVGRAFFEAQRIGPAV